MLTITLVGFGIGPPMAGAIADYYSAQLAADAGLNFQLCATQPALAGCAEVGGAGLRAGLIVALMFFVWAALHFWLIGRTYQQDRYDQDA